MESPPPGIDSPIPVSALASYSYCPRQCALNHLEQAYDDNIFTLKGKAVHERVDRNTLATVSGVRTEYGVPLWSEDLGLIGKADVVEFYGATPYPVEYKHGPARHTRHSDLQLCGQAMCLEEMLDTEVPAGAVYHFSSRQRREVRFDADLRQRVRQAVDDIRRILASERLPEAVADSRCRNCSLVDICLPFVVAKNSRNQRHHRNLFVPASMIKEASHGA